MNDISEGDLVCLKCGGPEMMVVAMTAVYTFGNDAPTPGAYCIVERNQFLHENAYPLYALEIVRPDRRRSARHNPY